MNELGLNRITPSMLSQYDGCPKLFYYSSWLGIKLPQPVIHFKFGTAIHNAIGLMYTTHSLNKAIESFQNEFTIDCVDAELYKTEAERVAKYGDMLHDGTLMLQEFSNNIEIFTNLYNIKPIQFELAWKEVLTNPETLDKPLEVPLSCRIDCIAENHTIVEYKTSAKEYDIFETRASPQALSYAWIYLQKYKVIPTIHYIVLIKKRKTNKIQHLKINYDMADLLMFDSKVRSIIENIKNRQFEKPLKGHPFFCECGKYEKALTY